LRPLLTETNDIRVFIQEPIIIERTTVFLDDNEIRQLQATCIDVIIPPAVD
jgi:hypothetical protein